MISWTEILGGASTAQNGAWWGRKPRTATLLAESMIVLLVKRATLPNRRQEPFFAPQAVQNARKGNMTMTRCLARSAFCAALVSIHLLGKRSAHLVVGTHSTMMHATFIRCSRLQTQRFLRRARVQRRRAKTAHCKHTHHQLHRAREPCAESMDKLAVSPLVQRGHTVSQEEIASPVLRVQAQI